METNRVEHILQNVNGHPAGSSCGNIWANESQKRTNPMRFEHFSLLYYSTGAQRVPLTRKKRVCHASKTEAPCSWRRSAHSPLHVAEIHLNSNQTRRK